ncbi:MAG: acyl-CoA desaturase [Gemmatimonadales bacterium]
MSKPNEPSPTATPPEDIIYPATIPFLLVHLAAFAAIWTGVTVEALIVAFALYVIRMFGVTAGNHRYFSHRTFRTSRVGQFLLAWLAQTSAQRGVLWWAAKHRHHHRYSDTIEDVHSPRHHGFWYSHVGWIFTKRHGKVDYSQVPDLAKYPELVFLDRHPYLPAAVLGAAIWLVMGWTGLVVGFIWSTIVLYHGTFAINSMAHEIGTQRYVTGDDSRNNWWLAIITLGEGWHNNHHAYQSSTRQGFRWYEVDITFYALTALSWIGVVWDLRSPPAAVVKGEQRLGRNTLEKVARELAASFPLERISEEVHAALARTPTMEELKARARQARAHAEAFLADLELPQVPSLEEIREYARHKLASTPSLDDIAVRTRELLLEALVVHLDLTPLPEGA